MDIEDAIAGVQRQNQLKATNAVSAKLDALQAELARQKAAEAAMPECPWCGGRIAVGFAKCRHCASDLIWMENFVCKPGQDAMLLAKIQAEKQVAEQKAVEEAKVLALRQMEQQEADRKNALAVKIGTVGMLILIAVGIILALVFPA